MGQRKGMEPMNLEHSKVERLKGSIYSGTSKHWGTRGSAGKGIIKAELGSLSRSILSVCIFGLPVGNLSSRHNTSVACSSAEWCHHNKSEEQRTAPVVLWHKICQYCVKLENAVDQSRYSYISELASILSGHVEVAVTITSPGALAWGLLLVDSPWMY